METVARQLEAMGEYFAAGFFEMPDAGIETRLPCSLLIHTMSAVGYMSPIPIPNTVTFWEPAGSVP